MAVHCDRCDRRFSKHHALRQHIRYSPHHYECPACDFDGNSWSELLAHCRRTGCRTVCQGCDNGDGDHWEVGSKEYWEHVKDDNVCTKCERHFIAPANLFQHQLSHRNANYECLGCYDMFKTYGGMLIHLEQGNCKSDIDGLELNALAAKCYMWAHFVDEDYRDDMLNRIDLDEEYYYDDKIYPYKCPTCGSWFPKLSSLFQHVESSSCSQSLDEGAIGKLRRFLRSRLG